MWHKGLGVCIDFEGRDGTDKGGTIEAILDQRNRDWGCLRVLLRPARPNGGRRSGRLQDHAHQFSVTNLDAAINDVTTTPAIFELAINDRRRKNAELA